MKKIIWISGSIIVLIVFFWLINRKTDQNYHTVARGDVASYIYEMGTVTKGDSVKLSFLMGGQVEAVLVDTKNEVEKGDALLKLDQDDLESRLAIAEQSVKANEASLAIAESEETKKIARAMLDQAEQSFESAKNNLDNTRQLSQSRINSSLAQGSSILASSLMNASDALDTANDINSRYLSGTITPEITIARQHRDVVEEMKGRVGKDWIESRDALQQIFNSLDGMLKAIEDLPHFLVADRQLINLAKSNINQSFSSMSSLIQSHDLLLSSTQVEISTAESQKRTAEINLARAQEEWLSFNRPETNLLHQSRLDQSRKERDLLIRQLSNATLKAPWDGRLTEILVKAGETVTPHQPVAVFQPDNDLQIEVDVYEGDIGKIEVGGKVTIDFVAFPEEKWSGDIFHINPNPSLVDGVIYYQVLVSVNNPPDNLRLGMTADLTIEASSAKNVLWLPVGVVKNNQVRVWRNNRWQDQSVVTGLRGEGIIEVISGLEEGDRIAL